MIMIIGGSKETLVMDCLQLRCTYTCLNNKLFHVFAKRLQKTPRIFFLTKVIVNCRLYLHLFSSWRNMTKCICLFTLSIKFQFYRKTIFVCLHMYTVQWFVVICKYYGWYPETIHILHFSIVSFSHSSQVFSTMYNASIIMTIIIWRMTR